MDWLTREMGTAETMANIYVATPSLLFCHVANHSATSKLFNKINNLGALMEIGTVFTASMCIPFIVLAYAVIFDKGK